MTDLRERAEKVAEALHGKLGALVGASMNHEGTEVGRELIKHEKRTADALVSFAEDFAAEIVERATRAREPARGRVGGAMSNNREALTGWQLVTLILGMMFAIAWMVR